jgi:hypothetical protein
MTTQEHLNKILAKCRELLALAEKRTPGKWDRAKSGGLKGDVRCESGQWIALTSFVGNSDRGGLPHQESNAACAGAAEAGWRSTIAAIEFFSEQASRPGLNAMAWGGLAAILAAWPEELL